MDIGFDGIVIKMNLRRSIAEKLDKQKFVEASHLLIRTFAVDSVSKSFKVREYLLNSNQQVYS